MNLNYTICSILSYKCSVSNLKQNVNTSYHNHYKILNSSHLLQAPKLSLFSLMNKTVKIVSPSHNHQHRPLSVMTNIQVLSMFQHNCTVYSSHNIYSCHTPIICNPNLTMRANGSKIRAIIIYCPC